MLPLLYYLSLLVRNRDPLERNESSSCNDGNLSSTASVRGIDTSEKIFAHSRRGGRRGGEKEKGEQRKRNEQWQRAWVHGADRTGCTCRCIGSGGQTGIRAVAPAHLPHPLVAGRRITVPPLPPDTQALCF